MLESILHSVKGHTKGRPIAFVGGAIFVYIDVNIRMINKQVQSGCYLPSERSVALEVGEKVRLGAYPIRCGGPDGRGWRLTKWVLEYVD